MTTYTIQSLLSQAGRSAKGDNRNRAIKNLNLLLDAGFDLQICQAGKVWTSDSGYKWNFGIFYKGAGQVFFTRNMTPYNLLRLAGKSLKKPHIQELIQTNVVTPTNCGKCRGKGILPQYMYYADGICFDCAGSGVVFNKETA